MFSTMMRAGRAAFIIGGQWGSEGKGASAAYLAAHFAKQGKMWNIVTTNAGAQAGHTSVHLGKTRVAYHLPTAALIASDYVKAGELRSLPQIYLNSGSIINPVILERELTEAGFGQQSNFFIHPNAAVITDDCIAVEGHRDSAQTKIASTRKGVGEALARKVLRYGMIAKDHPFLKQFVSVIDLNTVCRIGGSALVEVPQGISLSLNSDFYPFTTSRNCTLGQAISDADLHPQFAGDTMLVLRTYPIRVGNIVENDKELGHSGGHYRDQQEISWNTLGVAPEITTVTKRVRRVFTYSRLQAWRAMRMTRPAVVHLTFCDYPEVTPGYLDSIIDDLLEIAQMEDMPPPRFLFQYGPSTDHAYLARHDE